MADKWMSLPIACKGGLTLNVDAITQGTFQPGTAKILQNFECAINGGYRRISGYSKWDTNTVPGSAGTPILGVKAVYGGVIAARYNTTAPSANLYFSGGSGWGTEINTDIRGGDVQKVRMVTYSLGKLKVAGVDGVNPAWTWDKTTYTLINGQGAPADPKYIAWFNSSLALAGYSSNPNAVTLTSPGSDTNCMASAGAAEVDVGDIVTQIQVFRGVLYVFCENSIWKITGTDATTWAVSAVTTQIGCIAPDTVQECGGDLIYLAPDGFRSVAGTYNIGDTDLSLQSRAIQPVIANVIDNIADQVYSSCLVRKKSQYRCFFYDPSVSKQNTLGVIGKIEQGSPLQAFNYIYTSYSWSTTLGIQPYSADSYFDNGVERIVFGDPSNGYVYQLESGNDFDGTPIQAIYQSPDITFKDATLRKVMQKILLFTNTEGVNTVNLGAVFDFDSSSVPQPAAQSLFLTGGGSTYGGTTYGTGTYSALTFPVFRQNLVGSGFTTAFAFTSNGGAPYTILSFQVIYAQKAFR